MSTPSLPALQSLAVQAVRRGGHHALAHRDRRSEVHQALSHDVKLKLDLECQEIIEAEILAAYPDHCILGEEETGSGHVGSASLEWIIDPIDGTVNFSHGLPIWCCSVAVRRGDEMLAGAVYAPQLELLYEASRESDALCNGRRIQVSQTDRLNRCVVMTGADKDEATAEEPFRFFHAIAETVQRPRISGSAAIDICQVAHGNADGYFEPKIYIWDTAAAGLILERAGGTGQQLWLRSGQRMSFLATNGRIHDQLLQRVTPLMPAGRSDASANSNAVPR